MPIKNTFPPPRKAGIKNSPMSRIKTSIHPVAIPGIVRRETAVHFGPYREITGNAFASCQDAHLPESRVDFHGKGGD